MMDSENIKEGNLTDNSEFQLNKSFDESISETDTSIEKSLTKNINEINSGELSLNKENLLFSDSSIDDIPKVDSNLHGELVETNSNSIDQNQSSQEDIEQFQNKNSAEPMVLDDINNEKIQTDVITTDDKLPISEEGEEVFSGFTTKVEDIQDFDIIKGLSQQEEAKIQELITMEDKPVVESRPLSALNKRKVEESDISSQCSSPALSISSQQSVTSFTKRSRTESPASKGSRKSTVDLSNPKYLVPFEFGWRREVVTRAITAKEDGISKDVYYFHPSGKKLRSLREVSEKLTPGVNIENFTFYKEPLGADPQFETVRNARGHGQNSPSEFGTPRTPVMVKPRSKTPSNTDAVKSTPPVKNVVKTRDNSRVAKQEKIVLKFNKGTPKIALKKSPALNGDSKSPKSVASKFEGPKINPSAPLGPKRIITKRKNPLKPQNSDDSNIVHQSDGSEMDVGTLPSMWSPAGGSNISSSNESLSWSHLDEEKNVSEENRPEPCSIRCTKAMGLIPTLQCSVCLCLYHPECCEFRSTASFRPMAKYVCKNCQTKTEPKSRHLLKHITPAVVTCDQNTPIISPKPIHAGLAPSPTNQNNPSVVKIPQPSRPKINNLKPGNVGTWLPPSNTVFRAPTNSKPPTTKSEDSFPPQAIVNINNKRYIVVPKHNILSASSNQNQANKSDPAQNATIITPTPNSTIIQGPPLYNNPFIKPSKNSSGVTIVPYVSNEGVSSDSTPEHYHVVNPLPASSTTQPDLPVGSKTPDHFPKEIDKTIKRPSVDGMDDSMQKFMRNICIGYSALLNVFQYLKVQELLRAGRVCKLWRDLASHPSLWSTVRMKNSQVSDWQGFTDSLARHGTKHLDLRKILLATDETEETWKTFAQHIANVQCLERLDMCRCSVDTIEQILDACPQLLVFNAQMIGVKDQTTPQKLSLNSFSAMSKLTEVRLKSFFGFYLNGSLESLTSVADTLTMLSLTTVKDLGSAQVHFIGNLKNLETLELGECSDLPETFPTDVIAKLVKLKRIRFEKGPAKYSVNQMLIEMSTLPNLVQLELINFDIKPGFDEALASCTNIKRLMLIPTYVTHSATTNNIILSGAFRLWKSLTHFIWVVTMELLKVTELFVDQCEGPGSKKSGGNSVPVLKPVPKPEVRAIQPNSELGRNAEEDAISSKNPITVIPLNELSEMLTEALPNTRVKLIKIPFQSTWRQCINFSDSSSASLS